eukprot:scaffold5455_cov123-Isochrysis_galbana.AAC.2
MGAAVLAERWVMVVSPVPPTATAPAAAASVAMRSEPATSASEPRLKPPASATSMAYVAMSSRSFRVVRAGARLPILKHTELALSATKHAAGLKICQHPPGSPNIADFLPHFPPGARLTRTFLKVGGGSLLASTTKPSPYGPTKNPPPTEPPSAACRMPHGLERLLLGEPLPKNKKTHRQLETTQVPINYRKSNASKLYDLLHPSILGTNNGGARVVPPSPPSGRIPTLMGKRTILRCRARRYGLERI